MTLYILIGVALLIAGAAIGWKARVVKDEIDRDIEKAFEDALRDTEK